MARRPDEALTETRKADRAEMAKRVAEIAREFDCTAAINPEGAKYREHETSVEISTARDLCVTITFQARSGQRNPNTFVLPWHVASGSDTCLSKDWPAVNRYHWTKATDVAYDFPALLALLRERLGACKDGRAYDIEREAAYVAKHGTAAARLARECAE